MKLAFSISGHRSAAEAVALARAAEASGVDEIWITEDYCERGAYAVAGGIASATTRVRVGIGVVNPWTRHPMLLAMEHAALDELAGGRAVLGLGASNPRWMGEQLGIPFERPLDRLEEAVGIVRAALSGERVRRRGGLFEVDAALAFEPRRRDAPVVLGVKGRKALGLAGRIADGVLLSVLSSPAYVAWARRMLGAPVEVGAYVAFACERDAAAARDRLRPLVATFLGVHGDHDITRVAGLPAELAGRFRDGWVSGAPRTDLVTDELLDTFAVAGDRDDAAEGFRRLASAGVDVLIVRDDGGDDPAGLLASASACFALAEDR